MHDDERSTQEVMEVLGEDCDRCHAELISAIDDGEVYEGGIEADYEYHARQLIRSIFAYIEAVTFSVKAWSAGHCLDNSIEISPQERYFATDTEYELNERGEVVETVAKISLSRNIRFAISINRKAHGISQPFDASFRECDVTIRPTWRPHTYLNKDSQHELQPNRPPNPRQHRHHLPQPPRQTQRHERRDAR